MRSRKLRQRCMCPLLPAGEVCDRCRPEGGRRALFQHPLYLVKLPRLAKYVREEEED